MAKRPPNILWICTDQQRFDTIGALGNPHVSTPNIDRLVETGTAFDTVYCQAPICTPSRWSFLTGSYASTVHVNGNGLDGVPADHPPLVTKIMADAGYSVGNVGKLHLTSAYQRIEKRTDDGYDYFKYSHAPRDNWPEGHDYADWVREKGHVLADLTDDVDGVPADLHQTTWAFTRTREFIEARRDRPWMLTLNCYDPHPPFNPPAEYRAQFDPDKMPGPHFRESDIAQQEALAAVDFQSKVRTPDNLDINHPIISKPLKRGESEAGGASPGKRDAQTLQAAYYAMIKLIDDRLGELLDWLDETGQRENTIIIFTSDHGETLGDHGLIQKGCRFYEGLVRVPLIFSWPGHIEQGLVSDALVELTDKAPTILDFAGVPVPEHMLGRSLRPILEGAADPHQHRDFVRSEYYDALDLPDASLATMYRDRRHKLVTYHQHEVGELYDLEADPWEFDNLWDDPDSQATKFRLMKASFDATMRAIDKGPPRIGPM